MRVICWVVTSALMQLSVGPWPAEAVLAADPAESVVRLEALITEALANNPDLLAARKRWEAAQQKIPLAKGLPAPRIGIEFEEIPRGSVKFNQATLMYQLIQSLPFPGKLSARHQIAVKEAQMAAVAFKQAEWDVVSQVKAVYYELFLLDRELELQRQQLVWLNQAVAVAEATYAIGTASQTEVLRAQAEALTADNAVRVLTHRRLAIGAHLNHLLNRPAHSAVGVPEPTSLNAIPMSLEDLMRLAQERQPELLAFKLSAERADAALKLAKRELLPDLETMVELRDPAMGPFGPWDLTLALVVPFWFWTKLKYGVKAAVYDKDSAHAAYAAMSNEIARRINEHWHEAQASYETATLCRERLIELSQQAVASAMAAYQSGRGSFLDLLDALRMLAEQQRTYYQHLVSFEQHVVMLEQASGVPLRGATEVLAEGGRP